MSDYVKVEDANPDPDASPEMYASYLAGKGVSAIVVVRRLRETFDLSLSAALDVLCQAIGAHGSAFLREVELIEGLQSFPDDHSLARKVGKNTGIAMTSAEELVEAYRAGAGRTDVHPELP